MTSFPIFGGCICEGVRYKINGPPRHVVHCHCSQCRRSYASLVGTGATIEHEQIEIVKGKENLSTYELSPMVRRQFCKNCGCSILYYDDSFPEVVFYYPATLDNGIHPGHAEGDEHHVFLDSKASWEGFEDNLPKHAEGSENASLGESTT
ncbi:GFA family protein [Pseudomonadota bacterium]